MSSIILIDPINKGYNHVYFNATFLSCFSEHPFFIGHRSHVEKVKDLVPGRYLCIQDSAFSIGILRNFLILLRKSIFTRGKIFFLCMDNTLLPILLILGYPLLFTNTISLVIHNNLTTLTENKLKRLLHRAVARLYKARIFVLTKKMEQVYKSNIKNTDSCIYLIHPNYKKLLNGIDFEEDVLVRSKINIVLLGRQVPILMDYMKQVCYSKYSNIHFTFVYSNSDKDDAFHSNVTILKEKLSFAHYYSLLGQADFCLFASDKSVENRASGIFMDCITMGCPVIAPEMGHFLEYKEFKLGFLYKNYNDLPVIFDLIDHSEIRRDNFVDNFVDAVVYSSINKSEITVTS